MVNNDGITASFSSSGDAANASVGNYSISGTLDRSVLLDTGEPLNATSGAIRLTAVPEPGSLALLLAGFGLLWYRARRRG